MVDGVCNYDSIQPAEDDFDAQNGNSNINVVSTRLSLPTDVLNDSLFSRVPVLNKLTGLIGITIAGVSSSNIIGALVLVSTLFLGEQ